MPKNTRYTSDKGRDVLRLASVEKMQAILRNMLLEDRIKSLAEGTKCPEGQKVRKDCPVLPIRKFLVEWAHHIWYFGFFARFLPSVWRIVYAV